MSDLDAALNGLRFDPSAEYTGTVTLQVVTSDLGHTGGSALLDADSADIVVTRAQRCADPEHRRRRRSRRSLKIRLPTPDRASRRLPLPRLPTSMRARSRVSPSPPWTGGNGTWQYSLDAGATWSGVGSVSDMDARLLRSTDFVRFVPNGNDGTAAGLSYRAWDQTTGSAGGIADATTNGGATAFSAAMNLATLAVTAVNDAPTVTMAAASYAAIEQVALDLAGTGLAIADVDAGLASRHGYALRRQRDPDGHCRHQRCLGQRLGDERRLAGGHGRPDQRPARRKPRCVRRLHRRFVKRRRRPIP